MTAVGFEPTRIAPPELESGALDRSAKLSRVLITKVKNENNEQCILYQNKCPIPDSNRGYHGHNVAS